MIGRRLVMLLLLPMTGALLAHAQTVEYYHTDALGTPVAVTNATGDLIQRREYAPYGDLLNGSATDGPGYTGHVTDAATRLVYMQQRYYDSGVGRFLSVDPVTADGNTGSNFNRYWYAANNPYKFTDPDGRKIRFAIENGATFSNQATIMSYLYSSSTAAGELSQLHFSNETYTIKFDGEAEQMSYDRDSRTVIVNPTSGLRVKSSGKVQSPALGAGHEITHAAEHDRIGSKAMERRLEAPVSGGLRPDGVYEVRVGISPEEARATRVEGDMANELGEASRQDYHDQSGQVTTCSPTSSRTC